MIIDNIALIRSLLVFPKTAVQDEKMMDGKLDARVKSRAECGKSVEADQRDCFYVVQLIQRKKDNPAALYANKNLRNNRTLQRFQIYSLEDFDLQVPVIVEMAKLYQARAYIELNLKDSKDVFAALMKSMSERFATGNYRHIHRLYNEAVGETRAMSGTRRTWLVDVDMKDRAYIEKMKDCCKALRGSGAGNRCEIFAEVPTKNGVHLITSPFELDKFRK